MVGAMKPVESTKKPQEWLKQAVYDMKTAEAMFNSKRYIYAVFMCHLSIEKALKGLYAKTLAEVPPKTHNLVFLVEKMKIELPENHYDFVFTLNGLSIPTRYPDDLQKLLKNYSKGKTDRVLEQAKEVLKWLKARL
jgi:HEPN domain-containing protein